MVVTFYGCKVALQVLAFVHFDCLFPTNPFRRRGTVRFCLAFQLRFEHNDLINNRMVVLTKAQNDWHHPMCGCKLFACIPQAAH